MSKAVAIFLLGIALAAAMLAGGYIATRQTQRTPEQVLGELKPLDPPVEGPVASGSGAGGAAAGRGGSAGRPTRPSLGGGAAQQPQQPQQPSSNPTLSSNPHRIGGTPNVPAVPTYEEVEIPSGEIIELQLQSPLSSETAKVEDRVESRISKEVRVGQTIVVPAGTKLLGTVTEVDKGGRVSSVARLGVRFHTLVMSGVPDVPLVVDPIVQLGPEMSGDAKKKIGGGAAAGAGIGWLKGGVVGAITGAAVGAGAGTATKIVEGRKPAEVPAGATARVELRAPALVTVKR
jgi:hypothetical protein